jgi:LacI family transcriptional regulator
MVKPVFIGLVLMHNFAYYRNVLRGIRRYAEAKPNWLFTSIAPEQPSPRTRSDVRPNGLIASVATKRLARALGSWRRPVVNVSSVFGGLPFPRVGVDDARVGQLAADHFLQRGLRNFGFVGSADYLLSTERGSAFTAAVRAAGYEAASYQARMHLGYDARGQRWDLEPAGQAWLQDLPKPVGVFVPTDLWGVQVAEACRRASLRVPEDVAILGVGDDDLYCELTRPRLSSIVLPSEQIGFQAAALLDRLLGGDRAPRDPVLLSPPGVATRRSTEVLAIDDQEVVAAVRFIREHAHLPLRVADIVEHVPIARRTLERRCRAALGWGLGEEIRRTHLERAKRLLAETDLPMKVLAVQAGYSDFRQLDVAFRQEMGTTPTEYRQQMRGPLTKVGVSPPH